MRRVYAYVSVHARNFVNNIPAVKIFVVFGEYFLPFPYVYLKNVLYKSFGEFSADYDKKNNSNLWLYSDFSDNFVCP